MSFIDNITKVATTVGKIVKETYGPLAPLEGGNFTPTVYRYPLDVGNSQRYPHTIEFQTWIPEQVEITDLQVDSKGNSLGGVAGGAVNFAVDAFNVAGRLKNKVDNFLLPEDKQTKWKDIKGVDWAGKNGGVPDWKTNDMRVTRNMRYNDRGLSNFTRRASPSDLIAMYMPAGGWMDRVSNQYNQQSMTAAMGNAGLFLDAGSGLLQEYQQNGGQIPWGKAMDMLKGPLGMEAAGKVAGGLGMDAGIITDAGLNALGYALNPQFEMLYSGTDLREFQFDFTMTPRSQQEAETIRKIIKKFKYHASPAYVSGQGRYIVPPSYFDITFNFNGSESEWLPTISTCVLKAIDVDYSGGLEQWSTHSDGSPIQVKMTLTFAELEMMHKKLRRLGY